MHDRVQSCQKAPFFFRGTRGVGDLNPFGASGRKHVENAGRLQRLPREAFRAGPGGEGWRGVGVSCCCCCSHINSHHQVRGHRTGSSHYGVEEYPREKHNKPRVVNVERLADASHTPAKKCKNERGGVVRPAT